MFKTSVSRPFNPTRLYLAISNLVGVIGWTFKISEAGDSVDMIFEDSLSSFAQAINGIVTTHQTNYLADEFVDRKNRAKTAIDAKAGEVSKRYITDRTAQEVTYQIKSASAKLWVANGKPLPINRVAYPGLYGDWMARVASDPSTTVQATVDDVLATEALWYIKADQIEEQRRAAKIKIDAATEESQVAGTLTTYLNSLNSL